MTRALTARTTTESGVERHRVPGRRAELAVMVALIGPRLVSSFFVEDSTSGFGVTAVFTIASDLGLLALVWLLLALRSERLGSIGVRRPRWRDVIIGVVLAPPLWFGAQMVASWARDLGASPSQPGSLVRADTSPAGIALGVLLVVVVGITEEVVFRGYFLARFEDAGLRRWHASLAAGTLFVIGHGYEGGAALAAIVLFAAVMTRLVRLRHSVTSAVAAHAVYDLVAIVIVPILTAGR